MTASLWSRAARLTSVAVLCAISASASTARADRAAMAQALFDEGKKLMTAGNHAAACPKLEESQRLDPAGGTLLHMAACHEAIGKTATAWAEFNEALSAAVRDGRDDRAKFAREHIAKLEPVLVKIVVVVPEAVARIPGLEVKLDGLALGSAQWGAALPVDPGPHTVTASASGRKPWAQRLDVATGASTRTVTVETPDVDGTSASTPASTPAQRDTGASDGTGRRTAGLVLLGTGAAGVVVGTVFGLRALSKQSDAEPHCGGDNLCDQEGVDLRDQGITAGNVSTVAFAVAGAAVVAGVVLIATAPSSGGNAARIQARVGPTSVRVTGRW